MAMMGGDYGMFHWVREGRRERGIDRYIYTRRVCDDVAQHVCRRVKKNVGTSAVDRSLSHNTHTQRMEIAEDNAGFMPDVRGDKPAKKEQGLPMHVEYEEIYIIQGRRRNPVVFRHRHQQRFMSFPYKKGVMSDLNSFIAQLE